MKASFVTFWVWTAFSQPQRRRRALSLRSRPVTEMVPGARLAVGGEAPGSRSRHPAESKRRARRSNVVGAEEGEGAGFGHSRRQTAQVKVPDWMKGGSFICVISKSLCATGRVFPVGSPQREPAITVWVCDFQAGIAAPGPLPLSWSRVEGCPPLNCALENAGKYVALCVGACGGGRKDPASCRLL